LRRRDYHWSLYNRAEKNQLDGLRTDQVEAVFEALPKELKKNWFIWKEGFDGWKPFEDFPEILVSLRNIKDQSWVTPPLPPGESPAKIEKPKAGLGEKTYVKPKASQQQVQNTLGAEKLLLEDDGKAVNLSLMKKGMSEDRGNMRFQKSIDVRVLLGDKAFKNVTTDISLKGMQVLNPLPKKLPRYFNVEIVVGDRVIPVVCSEVHSPDGKPSNRLRIESNEYASALLTILLASA
jgi:hypothetical protein